MLRRVVAQPMEQMLGLVSLCSGGVLARHPKLRVAFLEANCTWLPWLLWRLDEGWEREGDVWAKDLTMAPSEYFKRQVFVSVEPDEAGVKYVIDYIGTDRLVFSTDYPARRFQVSPCGGEFSAAKNYRRRQTKNPLGQLRRVLQGQLTHL